PGRLAAHDPQEDEDETHHDADDQPRRLRARRRVLPGEVVLAVGAALGVLVNRAAAVGAGDRVVVVVPVVVVAPTGHGAPSRRDCILVAVRGPFHVPQIVVARRRRLWYPRRHPPPCDESVPWAPAVNQGGSRPSTSSGGTPSSACSSSTSPAPSW